MIQVLIFTLINSLTRHFECATWGWIILDFIYYCLKYFKLIVWYQTLTWSGPTDVDHFPVHEVKNNKLAYTRVCVCMKSTSPPNPQKYLSCSSFMLNNTICVSLSLNLCMDESDLYRKNRTNDFYSEVSLYGDVKMSFMLRKNKLVQLPSLSNHTLLLTWV